MREDLDNPWTIVTRNTLHEQKLRDWKSLGPQEKVLTKMADILEQVGREAWEGVCRGRGRGRGRGIGRCWLRWPTPWSR